MIPRILVVDDEPFIASGLQVFLQDEGMHVDCAVSGEEAIDMVRDNPAYAVCIIDMRLPGMNGDTAIRALHAIRPDLKFIIHTGSADYSIPDDLRAMGVDDRHYFAKPLLDMTPLANTVAALTAAREQV